jgi:triosephosphate isomerase
MNPTNQKPFVAGNWKMFKTIPEAVETVKGLVSFGEELSGAEVVVIPPFTAISGIKNALEGSPVRIGAQNVFWEGQGAFTGEISTPMLKDAGCTYVVIGHSERRQHFGETNETVNKKIKAVLEQGLTPILCFGESLEERKKNKTIEKVESQLVEGLKGLETDQIKKVILAYEPIWAIGTGLTATPEQAQEVHDFVRNKMSENYGNETGSCAIILYGGSVKPANTYSLLKERDINGALVGGASLDTESFKNIIKEAVKAYKEK